MVPILILGTAMALTMNQSLFMMEWVFIIFSGSAYSVVQTLREQLYIPASQLIKIKGKGFIDTFGFRTGDSLAAICFVVFISLLGFDSVGLEILVILSGIAAAYYLIQANRIYNQLNSKMKGGT